MTEEPRPYRRVLLTRMKFIGDIVLTTPIIRSVRVALPDAYIAYLGDSDGVSLLRHHPALDEIIPYHYRRPSLVEQLRVGLLLRRRKFDLVVDLFGNPRSALLTGLSGAKTRVGPARSGRGRLYTLQVQDDGRPKSAVEFHAQSIRAVGMELTSSRTEIFLTDDERREARIYVQWLDPGEGRLDLSKPIVALHPGATWPAKRWPAERFAGLADMLAAKLGAQILVIGGPRDDDALQEFRQKAFTRALILRNLPLRQLAAILSHCSAFAGNDAGPMHIAAAVGTPTIGIFGPGEENIWFPYAREEGHRAMRKDVPCHPCHLDFCNRSGEGYMECMNLLPVEEVFTAIQEAMRTRAARSVR